MESVADSGLLESRDLGIMFKIQVLCGKRRELWR